LSNVPIQLPTIECSWFEFSAPGGSAAFDCGAGVKTAMTLLINRTLTILFNMPVLLSRSLD
jgi:hypothetical protein